MVAMPIRVAVITVSDRAASGEYEDRSGPAARDGLLAAGFDCTDVRVVPDDATQIASAIVESVADGVRLVLTTGGTGLGPRDITPEATAGLRGVEVPGIAEAIRSKGLESTPYAMTSRGLAVVVDGPTGPVLVVNAPGSTGGAKDAVAILVPVLEHVVNQFDGGGH